MAKTKAMKTTAPARKVRFPEYSTRIAVGDDALTVDEARDILGWEETDDREAAILTDRRGKHVLCTNNVGNRPLSMPNVDALIQELLRKRWRVNGEPIIVGKTGTVLNGQHSLIALILAEQDREDGFPESAGYTEDAQKIYAKNWPNPITLEKFVVYGIDESDDVVNTMDTCKPRSLWEVICRSPFFASMKMADRRNASKMCEHAVRLVWHRTGAGSAFDLRKTHAESLDFITRHPKLLECVRHIYEENGGNSQEEGRKISKYVSLGYAAGMMYLMAASASDEEKYYKASNPSERALDFSRFDKAAEFWLFFADGSPEFKEVRNALGALANADTGTGGTMAEKLAILVTAWNLYVEGTGFTAKRLELEYHTNDDGVRKLLDSDVTVGGIDKGPAPAEDDDEGDGPTPEEIEAEKQKVKEEALIAKKNGESKITTATKPAPKKSPKEMLREKQEADAKAADAALAAAKGEDPPAVPEPSSNGTDPATGFKARPKVTINRPTLKLRGGTDS